MGPGFACSKGQEDYRRPDKTDKTDKTDKRDKRDKRDRATKVVLLSS